MIIDDVVMLLFFLFFQFFKRDDVFSLPLFFANVDSTESTKIEDLVCLALTRSESQNNKFDHQIILSKNLFCGLL